ISSTMARSRCWTTETVIGSAAGLMLRRVLSEGDVPYPAIRRDGKNALPRSCRSTRTVLGAAASTRGHERPAQGTELVDSGHQAIALSVADGQAHGDHSAPRDIDAGGQQVEEVELAEGLLLRRGGVGTFDRAVTEVRLHHAAHPAEVHLDAARATDVVQSRAQGFAAGKQRLGGGRVEDLAHRDHA